jgi:hypothetical protein
VAPPCPVPYIAGMAKLTKSNSVAALVDAVPTFGAGITIGITSKETGTTYHVHLPDAEAQRFAAFIAQRVEFTGHPSMLVFTAPEQPVTTLLRGGRGGLTAIPATSFRSVAR